jgi:hypothetical protein
MNYYLWQNDTQIGPFSENQLKTMWSGGQLTINSFYWKEGMPEWSTLAELQHILETAPAHANAEIKEKDEASAWKMKAKPSPKWRILIGDGVVRSKVLDYVEYKDGVLSARADSGKTISLPLSDAECRFTTHEGIMWSIFIRSKSDPNKVITFETNSVQAPDEWWEELKNKLDATEYISATAKATRATMKGVKAFAKGVIDLFKTPCPKCKNKDNNKSTELSRSFVGEVREETADSKMSGHGPKKYKTMLVYNVTYQWLCGKCSHEWQSSSQEKQRA